ncbi:lysophospholipid acyltransferase family protein [candidate division TA06 bacterium]|nr:lysophospholipid acyltransferase family protein [candidate division TA06 bacterium]
MNIVRLRKRLRDFSLSWIVQILYWLFQILPRSLGLLLGGMIGEGTYFILPRQRKKALLHLQLAYGETKSREEIRRMGHRVFIALGKNLVDVLRIPKIHKGNVDEIIEVMGMERFERTFQKGRGIIVITAHLGCWELISVYFSLKGYPVNVIGRKLPEERINGILQKVREGKEVRVIDRHSSLRETMECLRRGETLGILMDQNSRVKGIEIDFFGKPAHTPTGPVLLSRKTGAPLLPLAIHRTRNNRHRIEVGEEIEAMKNRSLGNGHFEKVLEESTRVCSKAIESFIRQYPTEWVWMHERWRKRQ